MVSDEIPQWARDLKNYYVVIRVDGRNSAMRRKYYRKVQKEKLRLVELGYCPEKINALCRYFARPTYERHQWLMAILNKQEVQQRFNFT